MACKITVQRRASPTAATRRSVRILLQVTTGTTTGYCLSVRRRVTIRLSTKPIISCPLTVGQIATHSCRQAATARPRPFRETSWECLAPVGRALRLAAVASRSFVPGIYDKTLATAADPMSRNAEPVGESGIRSAFLTATTASRGVLRFSVLSHGTPDLRSFLVICGSSARRQWPGRSGQRPGGPRFPVRERRK